ncbi:MAG TPA: chromosome segregation protein SMC [Ignavibacteriales bacterium]|nr:chromosome segregation protein SMC [Ignavibacteriales bacterium]
MYLSKLEILGFKSFAHKTQINFNQGITSIVGPNGCGKTNVVDALRWCLGEQKSGVLRSDKMENVIFNGTAQRKPMGMAEVSLTIENTKGILPTEYTDVTITRRIFRSGESEYLLNKNICRLKDITNLFMDTGIGANAYSVIELKMVETILSNKAEERRTMFEEAAGVNKYKLRRRLALRKLDEVKSDLTRVNDIVSEVEKKVSSLERQAKRADRYNVLTSQLRELEIDLSERELALFMLRIDESKLCKEENFKKKIQFESDIAKLEDEIKNARERLVEIENELKDKRNEITLQTEKIFNVQNSISLSNERKNSLTRNKDRYAEELNESGIQFEEAKSISEKGTLALSDFTQQIASKENEKLSLDHKVDAQLKVLEQKKNVIKEQSEILLEKFKEITGRENELRNTAAILESKQVNIKKLNDKIQTLTNNIAKTVGYIEELVNDKTEIQKKIADAESTYLSKQNEKEKLEHELNNLKEKELEQRSLIKSVKDKITFIQNLIDNLEGVSKGAKALLDNKEWSKNGSTILAHIGDSDEKFRFAIEAALKNNLNNLLVESLEDLKRGIEYLNLNDIGKASFYFPHFEELNNKGLINKIQNFIEKRKANKLEHENGFISWASSSIQTKAKWKPFFEKILKNICVVTDLETAFELFSKYGSFSFTTLNGDFVSREGIIEAGAVPRLDDSLFGRKQLLENLSNDFPKHEKDLQETQKEITKKENFLASIDLKVLSEQGRLLINDLANVEKQISQFEFEKKKADDEIEKIQYEIKEHAAESNLFDNKKLKLESLLNTEIALRDSEERKKQTLDEEFSEFEKNYNDILNQRNELNVSIERLVGEKRNTENAIKRAEESIVVIRNSIAKRKEDIESAAVEINQIENELVNYELNFNKLESERKILNSQLDEIEVRHLNLRNEVNEKETKLRSLRKEREVVSETIHNMDMTIKELDIKSANLIDHIKENYSLTLEKKSFDDLDSFGFRQRTDEVLDLKAKVKNLGPINLVAHSEYEEEKERLDFLHKQRDDLVESEKDVIRTIEEINNTAQAQFIDTFEKIRGHFVRIFRTLFNPGDEADLKIEENADPLEAKIEIIAKPKGKRPTSIELLSGGEKTLTAIALLFAIYLVKPSPFCILDEIDAPLDDANIDRFTRILDEFSKDTQFIVVTHNKRTMEAANTLYGVTMQEEGVSKLVSVRFNEDLDFVAN